VKSKSQVPSPGANSSTAALAGLSRFYCFSEGAAEEATPVLWSTGAALAPFEAGKTLKFRCPADGKAGNVWGTDTYTLDSSICTAAVHAGKIQLESGGPVTIEMRPGENSYKGSTRNGVKSNDYEKYGSSFIVK